MHRLAHHLTSMAINNAWANHRLLGACAQLSDEEFAAPRTSFFPSIKATANHILTVDWYYVDALERAFDGRPPNEDAPGFFDPEEPFASPAVLSAEQRAVDKRLIAVCTPRSDDELDRAVTLVRRRGHLQESAQRVLAHLFQHQIHHRGQIHAMLAGTRIKPPQLDEFFCANEAHLRAADLAALGITEATIWGD